MTRSNSTSAHASNPSTPSSSPPSTTSPAPAPAPVVAPITEATVAQCSFLFGQAAALIGPVRELTPRERMQSLKLRKGGAQVVAQLLAVCRQHGIASVGPLTLDSMSVMHDRATLLNEIGVALGKAQKLVSDATFTAEGTTWQYATALYTVLNRLALMDPTLAESLQPVVAFFQTKRTKGTQRTSHALSTVKKGKEAEAKLIASGKLAAPAAPSPSPDNGGHAAAPTAAATPATNGVAHS